MNKRILIIDDNEDDREILAINLQNEGFEDLVFAQNGSEGILAAGEKKPQIILLDTVLPGMNGFEVCRKIREIEGLDAKIIIMTGLIDAVDAEKARKSGADDYVVKTSDSALVVEAVKIFDQAGGQD